MLFGGLISQLNCWGPEIRASATAPKMVFEPGHPDADDKGFVAYPNINQVSVDNTIIRIPRVADVSVPLAVNRQAWGKQQDKQLRKNPERQLNANHAGIGVVEVVRQVIGQVRDRENLIVRVSSKDFALIQDAYVPDNCVGQRVDVVAERLDIQLHSLRELLLGVRSGAGDA